MALQRIGGPSVIHTDNLGLVETVVQSGGAVCTGTTAHGCSCVGNVSRSAPDQLHEDRVHLGEKTHQSAPGLEGPHDMSQRQRFLSGRNAIAEWRS